MSFYHASVANTFMFSKNVELSHHVVTLPSIGCMFLFKSLLWFYFQLHSHLCDTVAYCVRVCVCARMCACGHVCVRVCAIMTITLLEMAEKDNLVVITFCFSFAAVSG